MDNQYIYNNNQYHQIFKLLNLKLSTYINNKIKTCEAKTQYVN